MAEFFYRIARRLWPALDSMSEQRRLVGIGDVLTSLLISPLALAGLVWLAAATDWQVLRRDGLLLLVFWGLMLAFTRLSYFFIIEIRTDRYGSTDGSLAGMLQWTALLIFGPGALWLSVLNSILQFGRSWRSLISTAARWNQARALVMDLAGNTLAYLVALHAYRLWGGRIPFPQLTVASIAVALAAMGVHLLAVLAVWFFYAAYAVWVQIKLTPNADLGPMLRFLGLALGLPVLAHPFAILAAGIYNQQGPAVFAFLITGLLAVAYLTRQLSWAAESSRQQSRQLQKLESLSRAIITAPPDASLLPDLLEAHVPTMFPSGRIAIWLLPDRRLLNHPAEWETDRSVVQEWILNQVEPQAFLAYEWLPWKPNAGAHDPLVVTPILDADQGHVVGCIYIEVRSLSQPWDRRALTSLFPALQSLAAQIASVLHQAEIYAETLEYQATLQELEFAGRIQAGFLPTELPRLAGWELAVTLLPARETSGDYFDIIPFSDGRVGILIADVTDKGLGAALYMAISRTLIRTYALEYEASPDVIFFSVNQRILQDASTNLFVTAFFGVLDPASGELVYANAGHNPPFLLSAADGGAIHALAPTGMPIGVDEEASWSLERIQIQPGDTLVLYTDGIPDAQNSDGVLFRERRLLDTVQSRFGSPAQDIQIAILDEIERFVGESPQFDDITLLVLLRDPLVASPLAEPPSNTASDLDGSPVDP